MEVIQRRYFSHHSLLDGPGIDHVGVVATLSARPWVNILEAFEFELCFGFDDLVLLPNSVIGMDLRIGHSDSNRALGLRSLMLHVPVTVLQTLFSLFTKLVHHDALDRGLRSVRPSVWYISGMHVVHG